MSIRGALRFSARTTIEIDAETKVDIWASSNRHPGPSENPEAVVGIEIIGAAYAYLTADQIDAIIRALGVARVELSKARPQP
jgi:hypothetical protein